MELNESILAKTQRQKGGCFYACRALLLFALALGYASFAIRSSKDVKRALDNLSADFKDTNRKIDSNLEYLKQRDVVRELKMTSFGGKTESNPKTTSPSVPSSLKDSINANLKQVGANVVRQVAGLQERLLAVPKNDEFMGPRVLKNGQVWEEGLLASMLSHVKEGTNVVDVGANYGSYSVFFSQKVGPEGKVWAFEPQQYINRLLNFNMVLNDIANVQTIQSSVGHKEMVGYMSDKLSDGAKKGQNFETIFKSNQPINYGGRQLGTGGERVNINTLDSYAIKNISLLKVDVEGAECLVFWGARETIRREKPVIFGETNYQKLSQAAFDSLDVPNEVRTFDVREWAVRELGYTLKNVPNHEYDWMLLPP